MGGQDLMKLTVDIPLQTGNEKSRRAHHFARAGHVSEQRTAINGPLARELQKVGFSLQPYWSGKKAGQIRWGARDDRYGGDPAGKTAFWGALVTLTRFSPVPLCDRSESLPSALSAVRDEVAAALGVDDAEVSRAWGPDGEEQPLPGALRWKYFQRKGAWAVRIEIESA